MLDILSAGIAGLLILGALYQFGFVLAFARACFRWRLPAIDESRWPKVALLVGLRGADPFLADGLRRLMRQNYPRYRLFICVDSPTDPAWPVVEQTIADTGSTDVHVEPYRDLPEHGPVNCTNSKVVQLAAGLDDSYEVIAMADADLMPEADWLRTLVAPLVVDATVGATFGNPWYMPPEGRFGSLVRYVWKAAGAVFCWALSLPWGGCFAIRADVVRRHNLVEAWSRVIALDACTPRHMRAAGLRTVCIPALLMANREECSLPYCLNFFQRHQMWTRLYHDGWWLNVAATLGHTALLVAAVACCAGGLLGFSTVAWFGALGLGVYLVLAALGLGVLELAARRSLAARGVPVQWLSPWKLLKLLAAIPVAQAFQAIALVRATFARRVAWRGIELEIVGPFELRTVETRESPQADSLTSV